MGGMTDEAGAAGILTIPQFLERAVRRFPDVTWLRTPDGDASRLEVHDDACRVVAALRALGLTPGEHVVIVLPNGLDFVRAWLGVILAGGIAITANPKAVGELAAVVADTGTRFVISRPDLLDAVPAAAPLPPAARVLQVGELLAAAPAPPAPATPGQHAGYIQSSGSTGRPKFVIETHGMYTMAGEGFPFWLDLTPSDVLLTCLPLSHINAQAYSLLGSLGLGAELVLLPQFSAGTILRTARETGATVMNAIGAMLEILMSREPDPADRDHRLRHCYSGPAPARERHQAIEQRFGFRVVVGYALSESPYGLICPVHEPPVYGSTGRPRQHPRLGTVNTARIIDPVTGVDVAPGRTGELLLRNPATTPGYLGLPAESAAVLRDGWLHTGDLMRADAAGNHFFAGRVKEIIRRRGENLSPADVEVVLDAHPAVAASAVIGVPSPLTEEDVKAFVQLRSDGTATAAQLHAWCAERLPPYKVPRYLELVTQWPLTETSKIAKRELPAGRTATEVDFETPR
jgi:carnitine-CoA ligase